MTTVGTMTLVYERETRRYYIYSPRDTDDILPVYIRREFFQGEKPWSRITMTLKATS